MYAIPNFKVTSCVYCPNLVIFISISMCVILIYNFVMLYLQKITINISNIFINEMKVEFGSNLIEDIVKVFFL